MLTCYGHRTQLLKCITIFDNPCLTHMRLMYLILCNHYESHRGLTTTEYCGLNIIHCIFLGTKIIVI